MTSSTTAEGSNVSIRPFQIDIPEESLQELRRRVATPRWPDRETVDDRTQGIQLARVQQLVDYWATDYDWRNLEARMKEFPQFITEIDGLDIHFIHVRSPHANVLPLIMTHGWPGSFLEFVKVIGPLATPNPMEPGRRTRSIWSCRQCPGSASPPGRRRQAGIPNASPARGLS